MAKLRRSGAIVLAAVAAGCSNAPAVDVAITDARVFTASGAILEGAEVRIAGDRIVAVGTDLPAGAARETIDASELTVLPGLIDTHVHLLIPWPPDVASDEALATHVDQHVLPDLREYLDHGVTTVFSTGDYWPAIRDLRDRVAAGEVPGPRIRTAGPVFTGPGGHPAATICESDNDWCRGRLAVEVETAAEAREAVARLASEGVDAIKAVLGGILGPSMDREVFAAVVEAAHAAGLRAYVHPDEPPDARAAIHAGADGLVHLPGLGAVPDSVLGLVEERGLTVATTLGPISPVAGPDGAKRHPYAGYWSDEFEAWVAGQKASVRALTDAGDVLVLGTDVPMFGPWDAISREIDLLSDAGLTNEQILLAATRNAAVHLGLDAEVGTVEVGKVADLLLVRGDPLEDLAALSDVQHVIQNGEIRR